MDQDLQLATESEGARSDTPAPDAADWRADLSGDLLRHAEKFATPEEAVKAHREAQQQISRMVAVPGEDASPEEMARFRRQLGVPESPADYTVAVPEDLPDALRPGEGDDALRHSFLEAMHRSGATQAQVQTALDWYYGMIRDQYGAHTSALSEYKAAQESDLRRAWGGSYETNVAAANRFVQSFAEADADALLGLELKDGGLLGAHPAFVRLAARAGQGLVEHRPDVGTGAGTGGAAGEARLDALTRDIWTAQDQGDSDLVARLSAERDRVSQSLFGGRPVVGRDGRGV